ncbi:Ribokinase-like protein [Protomyces lactucae-debilis]|uniref:Ribokinase-like protein n=1 Tax=Protomyces lactucae-debilis TaxID=2754530 RepID=A0A1Y2FGS6_PROLT|nr:Ribokinase-like protein [Protomyces lactucae-debilis]ORY82015.1 Ribokinase-like protein [Protomyces lactucae-debilis]
MEQRVEDNKSRTNGHTPKSPEGSKSPKSPANRHVKHDDSATETQPNARQKSSSSRKHRVFVVGSVFIDTILTLPGLPELDQKLRATESRVRVGGNAFNTAAVLAQDPSTEVYLVASVPDAQHYDGKRIRNACKHHGIRPLFLPSPHTTACTAYILETAGHRTIISHDPGSAFSFTAFQETVINRARLGALDHVHFETRVLRCLSDCIGAACQAGAMVSVEYEKCDTAHRKLRYEVSKYDYTAIFSSAWEDENLDEVQKDEETGAPVGLGISHTMLGERGVLLRRYSSKASRTYRTYGLRPLQPIVHPVENTGAGDTYIAGVILGNLRIRSKGLVPVNNVDIVLRLSAQYASILAMRKIQQVGFEGVVSGRAHSSVNQSVTEFQWNDQRKR